MELGKTQLIHLKGLGGGLETDTQWKEGMWGAVILRQTEEVEHQINDVVITMHILGMT